MTSLADRTIVALRTATDDLAAQLPVLTPDQLTGPSAASEWTVAQVLSHLGSGAEIALASLTAATDGAEAPGAEDNQRIWARWDALDPEEQSQQFLGSNEKLTAAFEALTAEQRETVRIDLGFTPEPLSVTAYAGMRLNEFAQHSWDVAAGLDPAAELSTESAGVLLEQFGGPIGFLLGFIGKADRLTEPVVLALPGTDLRLAVDDRASLTSDGEPTATFEGPTEAVVRLLCGRLRPEYTADGITVTGNVTLDELRRVFPGF